MKASKSVWTLLVALASFLPMLQLSEACSVCFGDPQSHAVKGMNLAILTLLGITLGVLGGVVAFMIHLSRKSTVASQTAGGLESDGEDVPLPSGSYASSRSRDASHSSHHASHTRNRAGSRHHHAIPARKRRRF